MNGTFGCNVFREFLAQQSNSVICWKICIIITILRAISIIIDGIIVLCGIVNIGGCREVAFPSEKAKEVKR